MRKMRIQLQLGFSQTDGLPEKIIFISLIFVFVISFPGSVA